MAGVGAGMFVVPQLALWCADYYGSFGFFICLAGIAMQIIVCGMLMRPSNIEKHSQMKRRQGPDLNLSRHSCTAHLTHYTEVMKHCVVICVSSCSLLYCMGIYSVFVYLPYYVIELGGNEIQGSFLLSVCGIASIFGRFGVGLLANTNVLLEPYIHSGCLSILAVNTLVFPLVSKFSVAQFVFAAFTGLLFGSHFVLLTPTNIRFLGMETLVVATSIEMCTCGVGGIIGPTIAGKCCV